MMDQADVDELVAEHPGYTIINHSWNEHGRVFGPPVVAYAPDGAGMNVRFMPSRTDDLVPEVAEWVGRNFTVVSAGVMDEGPYSGHRIFLPLGDGPVVGWIPECDLVFSPT